MFAINDEMSGGDFSIVPAKISTGKKLSKEELLEVSENISLYYAPKISHISRNLTVLPIDPQKIFVYWNLGDEQAQSISSHEADNELKLRIYTQSRQGKKNSKTKLFNEFVIHHGRSSQTIILPSPETALIYSASIGTKTRGKDFIPLVNCNNIPAFKSTVVQQDIKYNHAVTENPPVPDVYDQVYKEVQIETTDENALYYESVVEKTHFASTNHSGTSYTRQV